MTTKFPVILLAAPVPQWFVGHLTGGNLLCIKERVCRWSASLHSSNPLSVHAFTRSPHPTALFVPFLSVDCPSRGYNTKPTMPSKYCHTSFIWHSRVSFDICFWRQRRSEQAFWSTMRGNPNSFLISWPRSPSRSSMHQSLCQCCGVVLVETILSATWGANTSQKALN